MLLRNQIKILPLYCCYQYVCLSRTNHLCINQYHTHRIILSDFWTYTCENTGGLITHFFSIRILYSLLIYFINLRWIGFFVPLATSTSVVKFTSLCWADRVETTTYLLLKCVIAKLWDEHKASALSSPLYLYTLLPDGPLYFNFDMSSVNRQLYALCVRCSGPKNQLSKNVFCFSPKTSIINENSIYVC